MFLEARQHPFEVALHRQLAPRLVARRQHHPQFAAVAALRFEPRIHPLLQLPGLLGIELILGAQRAKFRPQIRQLHRHRRQAVRQRLARGVEAFELVCLADQRGQTRHHAFLPQQARLQL